VSFPPPSEEPRNPIEYAADQALDLFRDLVGEIDDPGYAILLARVPGMKPDAITASSVEAAEMFDLLLAHAGAVAKALGIPFAIGEVGGQG
jgi:hypothetical protein